MRVRGHDAVTRRAAILPHPTDPPNPPRSPCAHVLRVPANASRSFGVPLSLLCSPRQPHLPFLSSPLLSSLSLSAAMTSAKDATEPLKAAQQPQEQVGRAREPDHGGCSCQSVQCSFGFESRRVFKVMAAAVTSAFSHRPTF